MNLSISTACFMYVMYTPRGVGGDVINSHVAAFFFGAKKFVSEECRKHRLD